MMEAWTLKSEYPQWIREAVVPCVVMGETNKKSLPIFSPDACLPDKVGAFIWVEKGVWRVLADELAKAKGVPVEWITWDNLMAWTINLLTDLHIGQQWLPAWLKVQVRPMRIRAHPWAKRILTGSSPSWMKRRWNWKNGCGTLLT